MKWYIFLKNKILNTHNILILFIFFNITYSYSQTNDDSLFVSNVLKSFQTANVNAISQVVYKKVDVTLPNQNGIFSKYQIKLILQDFFKKAKPDTFILTNQYKKMNENFIVGKIKTQERYYRVCLLTKLINNKNYIYQIRIEK